MPQTVFLVSRHNIALYNKVIGFLLLISLFTSCRQSVDPTGQTSNDDNVVTDAQLLIMRRAESYTQVDIKNPWKEGETLHSYVLVPADKPLPDKLPKGTVVRTPIKQALVYSSVHSGLMKELGAIDAVAGVADSQYFSDEYIKNGLASGRITDCGNSMSPTIEKVIAMQPDAILLSPYQDATYGQVTKLNIPIIECADYLEYTPLGRAEWIKFYGELTGKSREADSIFEAVKTRYNAIRNKSAGAERKPSVVTEMVISNIWNVPGGASYMAAIIRDAGGAYPWADDKHTGSLALDFNQVLDKAQKVDYWFIKWTGINTLADLKGAYALNDRMEAFQKGNVYVCDTDATRFFDRIPFHPELLLQEFAAVLHPELFSEVEFQFYKRIDK